MRLKDVRDHYRVRPGYWFAPKMFGWGATPVTWQGWLATLGFCGAVVLAVTQLPGDALRIAVAVPLALAFLWVVVTRTDRLGWHWGPDER